MILQICHRLRR